MPDYDKFQIRFPEGMRERLEDAAKKHNRSLHSEIVDRLRVSLETPPVDVRLSALEQAVAQLQKKGR
jgi:hypothetical protein